MQRSRADGKSPNNGADPLYNASQARAGRFQNSSSKQGVCSIRPPGGTAAPACKLQTPAHCWEETEGAQNQRSLHPQPRTEAQGEKGGRGEGRTCMIK